MAKVMDRVEIRRQIAASQHLLSSFKLTLDGLSCVDAAVED